MSDIQIYYVYSDRIKKSLLRQRIDLDMILRTGDKTTDQVYNEIKTDPNFCRNEESISYSQFLSLIMDDITLYASQDEKIVGALTFMFNLKDRDRVIYFSGICSPIKYSGLGVGQELINTLIRIAKNTDTKYIYLECKGNIVNYYRNKFGFEITSTKKSYDSDDSDDDDNEPYYNMRLDLSRVTGGKKRKSIRKSIKKRSRRTRRKLRK